jgi:hypothetical protein
MDRTDEAYETDKANEAYETDEAYTDEAYETDKAYDTDTSSTVSMGPDEQKYIFEYGQYRFDWLTRTN